MKPLRIMSLVVIILLLAVNTGIAQGPQGKRSDLMSGWLLNHANDIDTNNDKIITIDDLILAGKEAVEGLDKDNDGKLSGEELLVGKTNEEKRAYGIPLTLQAGWVLVHSQEIDVNGDGFVTRLELISQVMKTVKLLDKNLDAKLTGDEVPKLATGEGADLPPDAQGKEPTPPGSKE